MNPLAKMSAALLSGAVLCGGLAATLPPSAAAEVVYKGKGKGKLDLKLTDGTKLGFKPKVKSRITKVADASDKFKKSKKMNIGKLAEDLPAVKLKKTGTLKGLRPGKVQKDKKFRFFKKKDLKVGVAAISAGDLPVEMNVPTTVTLFGSPLITGFDVHIDSRKNFGPFSLEAFSASVAAPGALLLVGAGLFGVALSARPRRRLTEPATS